MTKRRRFADDRQMRQQCLALKIDAIVERDGRAATGSPGVASAGSQP
jgi:hypothetical protein